MPVLQHVNPWVVAAQAVDAEKQRRAAEERQAELDAEKVRQFNANNDINARQVAVGEGGLTLRRREMDDAAQQHQQLLSILQPVGQPEMSGGVQGAIPPQRMPRMGSVSMAPNPMPITGIRPVGSGDPQRLPENVRRAAWLNVMAGGQPGINPADFNQPKPQTPPSTSDYQDKLARYAKDIGKTPETLTSKDQLAFDKLQAEATRAPEKATEAFIPDAEQVDSFARQLIEHRMAPSQLNSMIGGFGTQGQAVKRAVLERAIKIDPDFNFQEAESNYVFGRSPATQATVRFIDNISDSIPVLRTLVGEMKLGGVKVVNAATIATKSQFGQKAAAQYELARTIIADEFAKTMQGGGTGSGTSDAKLNQALKILGGDMSPEQWDGVLETANELLSNRRDKLTQGTYMERKSTPAAASTRPPQSPKLGDTWQSPTGPVKWTGRVWAP